MRYFCRHFFKVGFLSVNCSCWPIFFPIPQHEHCLDALIYLKLYITIIHEIFLSQTRQHKAFPSYRNISGYSVISEDKMAKYTNAIIRSLIIIPSQIYINYFSSRVNEWELRTIKYFK